MPTTLSNIELLSRLVSFDSVSHNSNIAIADFICDYLDGTGGIVEHFPNEPGGKVNLLIRYGPEENVEGGLVLSGHLDVVPADEEDWESDPFTLTQREGSLYGRGACDMKASIAIFMNLIRSLHLNDSNSVSPLWLLLTFDEELGSLGAQQFARTWPRERSLPRSVLIGEPTSLRAARMHKGHLKLRINIRGVEAHSGFPHLGENAIEKAGRIIERLSQLRSLLKSERTETSEHFQQTPFVALNIARIQGGTAVNIIPGRCIIDVGMRLLPGMATAEAIADVLAVLKGGTSPGDFSISVVNDSPPMLTAATARIHEVACDELNQSTSFGVPFSSDGGVLSRDLGLECILFGPGSIDTAHRANEYVPIEEFNRAATLVERIVQRYCTD